MTQGEPHLKCIGGRTQAGFRFWQGAGSSRLIGGSTERYLLQCGQCAAQTFCECIASSNPACQAVDVLLFSQCCLCPITAPQCRWFFQQLVLTMEYFHRRGISHRDIKVGQGVGDALMMELAVRLVPPPPFTMRVQCVQLATWQGFITTRHTATEHVKYLMSSTHASATQRRPYNQRCGSTAVVCPSAAVTSCGLGHSDSVRRRSAQKPS
jgi:hypothetical protein